MDSPAASPPQVSLGALRALLSCLAPHRAALLAGAAMALFAGLAEAFQAANTTALIIAHRLSTVLIADLHAAWRESLT